MAFRHSTYHAPPRLYTSRNETESQALPVVPPQEHIAESQEWILFSPTAESTTNRTYTTSTARTQTAGRSRISDFGSLDTAARSNGYDFDERSAQTEEAIEEEEEDGELDSLDSHLHEFRAEPSVYRSSGVKENGEASQSVLPTHDGLGSFRVDQPMNDQDVQDQLYAFEKYNPRRVKRRRESLELGQMELDSDRAVEVERTRRIEQWRMEQSRLLVDEIQKETRRRKQSMSSEKRSVVIDQEQEDMATLSTVESSGYQETEVAQDENQSFWNRITKRVIQDLMGIDDDLLSIIFGESLPESDDLSSTPPANRRAASTLITTQQYPESSWEYRLLDRVARELGILVNQLTDHPGALSTYLKTQQVPLPYAGLPVIPETAKVLTPQPTLTTSQADPQFLPTIPTAQAIPIPQASTSFTPTQIDEDATPRQSPTITPEEWERDLDIKMVFRYLRSRFTGRPSPPTLNTSTSLPSTSIGTSHLATASTSETAARAARVRQHHPLVTHTRRRSVERRTFKPSVPTAPGIVRRGSSSCASERMRSAGSSRHYWDFGGSVGSGSMIAGGNVGSWGEV
ncbi:hypothetical protein GLAREA_11013 [Glarea lozoyensis ATCC 20868]|uniref:Uncharacterized protein n=1 Tax=Glarea lozoyensis (strain ATCC 20868 / MF5171) TaxID=1116229 RepID=S3DE07_GLAL2|nr:uncharacterized protein GLAREA_11013 [Glarea lozoyensis ATCC 20868]EPE35314.1 hypothetical protein GLAREA_11013 [Glarea lozoyensis ATCC 20868]